MTGASSTAGHESVPASWCMPAAGASPVVSAPVATGEPSEAGESEVGDAAASEKADASDAAGSVVPCAGSDPGSPSLSTTACLPRSAPPLRPRFASSRAARRGPRRDARPVCANEAASADAPSRAPICPARQPRQTQMPRTATGRRRSRHSTRPCFCTPTRFARIGGVQAWLAHTWAVRAQPAPSLEPAWLAYPSESLLRIVRLRKALTREIPPKHATKVPALRPQKRAMHDTPAVKRRKTRGTVSPSTQSSDKPAAQRLDIPLHCNPSPHLASFTTRFCGQR